MARLRFWRSRLLSAWHFGGIDDVADNGGGRSDFQENACNVGNKFRTTDPIPPEELDPRGVWWGDRYKQLNNRGCLLRPPYFPRWVPSIIHRTGTGVTVKSLKTAKD